MEPSAWRSTSPCLGPPELTVTSFPWWDGPVLGVKKSGALGRGRPGLPERTAPSASVSSSLHGGGGLGLHFHLGMCLGVPEAHLDGELSEQSEIEMQVPIFYEKGTGDAQERDQLAWLPPVPRLLCPSLTPCRSREEWTTLRQKRAQLWSWVKPPVQTDLCSPTHRDGLDKSHPLSVPLAPRVSHERLCAISKSWPIICDGWKSSLMCPHELR